MERKHKEPKPQKRYNYKSTFPLFFWKRCEVCGNEFRYEKLHKFSIRWCRQVHPKHFGIDICNDSFPTDHYYYCTKCCDRTKAKKQFENTHLKRYYPIKQSWW